jgi:signal transduction histidine kinase
MEAAMVDTLPETFFAAPERASHKELVQAVKIATANPIFSTVMRCLGGVLAVLNDRRQILAVNEAYLRLLGIEDAAETLGLRPGEAIRCEHAKDHPAGCGTGRFCETCGKAIAIVVCLTEGRPVERECALSVQREGRATTLDLVVRATPIQVERETFILLLMRDITETNRRGAMVRAFFHDINNVLVGLVGASEILVEEVTGAGADMAREVRSLADRLAREVEIQRSLLRGSPEIRSPRPEPLMLAAVLAALDDVCSHHPAATGRRVRFGSVEPEARIETDSVLLLRVLTNMLINALEATPTGGEVRLTLEQEVEVVTFKVWNPDVISAPVALRIFQRHFTTKDGSGRGQGTFVIKHFTENYLHGDVGFTTSPDDGTTFWIRLPRSYPRAYQGR